MDEAEQYKQRLEAIAEKRRLQEEQDRARREMEDERLRLQQLKRKSLRDQWLMDGAPLSPTSLDTLSPVSASFGFPAKVNDSQTDMLHLECQQSAEETLKEQMENSQMKTVELVEEGGAEGEHVSGGDNMQALKTEKATDWESPRDVVQNGESNAEGSDTAEEEENQSPQLNEFAIVLPNGSRDLNTITSDNSSEQINESINNGPICITEVVASLKLEPGMSLDVSETEPGQGPNVNINEEEEEATLVMRAERVIITDEGDDVPEEPEFCQDPQNIVQSEEIPTPNPDTSIDEGEAVEGQLKEEPAEESLTHPEMSEATEPTTEAQPATEDTSDVQDDIKTKEDHDTKAKGEDKESEDPKSAQLQSPGSAVEGAAMASVPVYSEAQSSTVTHQPEAEPAVSSEETKPQLTVQDPATIPDQFQEVPLADPKDHTTEAEPGEQEPLLLQSKAHNTQAAPTGTNSPAGAVQGENTQAPRRKACQCCSVM